MRKQTARLNNVYLKSSFSSGGKKESEGPLGKYFDAKYTDVLMGQECWEKAESQMLRTTVSGALTSAKLSFDELDLLFAGDLLNQCTASSFGLKSMDIPLLGLYGACSTFVEGLCLASMAVDGGFAKNCGVVTSSHFCSSQKQYRFPLAYGEVRTPTSQWTVTASGCAILSEDKSPIKLTAITPGRIVDLGVCDANNMGAAMAPAAADTIYSHLCAMKKSPDDYDYIITGDLALVGSELLYELLKKRGVDISKKHLDCGTLVFDSENQKVNAGGSGCGCVASVFSGYIAKMLAKGKMKNILLVATGALMSPSSVLLGESISGIAHGAEFERIGD